MAIDEEKLVALFKETRFPSGLQWNTEKTAEKLKNLRENNIAFRKTICKHSRLYKYINKSQRRQQAECQNAYQCDNCKDYYTDTPSADSVARFGDFQRAAEISNLEKGINLTFDKVLLYAYMAKVPLAEILVLNDGWEFVDNIIIKKEIEK